VAAFSTTGCLHRVSGRQKSRESRVSGQLSDDWAVSRPRAAALHTSGAAVTRILPPVAWLAITGGHGEKKARALARLGDLFDRLLGLGGGARQ
jgi:hypothetical protein